MPLSILPNAPTIVVRRAAFERSGLTRSALDDLLNLTPEEFRVERGLVAIGPIPDSTAVSGLIEELEQIGLVYFDDFFELSGNWPEWLSVHAGADD